MPTSSDAWESRFERFVERRLAGADPAHDLQHVRRVVATARELADAEGARLEVVVPAAWLHDCVTVPKSSAGRASASAEAAELAASFLGDVGYPQRLIPPIRHAIEAHSFSAGIAPETIEAKIVQDADRLDALGAVGIARWAMVGGLLRRPLYDPREPFPRRRAPDDSTNALDHFFLKLLELPGLMHTDAGRGEARRRGRFMRSYLRQLQAEIEPRR